MSVSQEMPTKFYLKDFEEGEPILLLIFIILFYSNKVQVLMDNSDLSPKLAKSKSTDSSSSRKKIDLLTQQQQEESPLVSEFALADTIQIIKCDGTVLCTYQTHQHLQVTKLIEIRKEVIEYSRKLSLEAYENDTIESIFQGFYVCFRVRQGIIFYAVSCSSYSYSHAEQLLNSIIAIFDQTLVEVFGQKSVPKNLTQVHLLKLESIKKKISNMLKYLISINMRGTMLNKKAESFAKFVSQSRTKIEGRRGQLRSNSVKTEEMLKSSLELKLESQKLSKWIALKRYLLFLFVMVCLVMVGYLFLNWY